MYLILKLTGMKISPLTKPIQNMANLLLPTAVSKCFSQ